MPRLLVAALALLLPAASATAAGPPLWGYGVRSCAEFLGTGGRAGDNAAADPELARYRDWLTGFVSGLNLATNQDVLGGADIETALLRARAHCAARPADDFFNAVIAVIRSQRVLR